MKKKYKKIVWLEDNELEKDVKNIVTNAKITWVNLKNIYFFRSYNSKARAYARIWGLSKIWQLALKIEPSYVIEIISEKYDRLDPKRKSEVLVHELTHIPKNFSGSLIPHIRKKGKRNFHDKVHEIIKRIHS